MSLYRENDTFIRYKFVVENVSVTYKNSYTVIYDMSVTLSGGMIC